jgi:hypothetical protein
MACLLLPPRMRAGDSLLVGAQIGGTRLQTRTDLDGVLQIRNRAWSIESAAVSGFDLH